VQLRFSPADLTWVRGKFSRENTGWPAGVKLVERRDSALLVLTLKH